MSGYPWPHGWYVGLEGIQQKAVTRELCVSRMPRHDDYYRTPEETEMDINYRSTYWQQFGVHLAGSGDGKWHVYRDNTALIDGNYSACVMFAEELCERIKAVRNGTTARSSGPEAL